MQTLTLYSGADCHLCEQAQAIIAQLPPGAVNLQIVDIASDFGLKKAYGLRIPVVSVDQGKTDLGWPFDLQELREYLARV